MVRSSRILGILIVASLLITAALAACGAGSAEPTQAPSTAPTVAAPAADGAALLDERCSACHSAGVPKQLKMSRSDWDKTVSSMVGRGAKLTDAEKAVLLDYLAQTYGP